jgi:hypothetical protein
MEPTKFILEQSGGPLTSLVGQPLHRFAQLPQLVDPSLPVRSGIPNSDILAAMVGLLCQGKSDFEAIERFRQDPFYPRALMSFQQALQGRGCQEWHDPRGCTMLPALRLPARGVDMATVRPEVTCSECV